MSNINSSYFGVQSYPTKEERVVAYLYFIIKDHSFTDGNKRTASLSFEIICELNNLEPDYHDFSLDQLAVFVEQIKPQDHQLFIHQLMDILFVGKK
ncbi:MAG: Fic family protein [Candidatus Pacebacteria bacterium]|nr:Fic family protein [Candidatus Paceibacterota bacterium]